MTEQRFPAGATPRVRIGRVRGDLRIEVWDEDALLVRTDGRLRELYQEGDELAIEGADDDLELQLPARVAIVAASCDGDVTVEGVRRVELERIGGDLDLTHIAEEAVFGSVGGDVRVEATPVAGARGQIGGDASLVEVGRASVADVDGSLDAEGVASLSAGNIGGDLAVERLAGALQALSVGGDLRVEQAGDGQVSLSYIGGDVRIDGQLSSLQAGEIGGDCDLAGPCGQLSLGRVGGDLRAEKVGELRVGNVGGDMGVERVTGQLQVGSVGGDAKLGDVQGALELASVGGDLKLRGAFAQTSARVRVGGDASVEPAEGASLTLTALVGGDVRGVSGMSGTGAKRITLRYGAGEGSLDLNVAGDLRLGGAQPASSSASTSTGPGAGGDWEEFGREMGDLGRELGRLGREIADEITAAFTASGVAKGSAWAEDVARRVEEQARRVERKAEEQARRSEEQARRGEARVRVKINEREWQLDPERLERIKEQARRAAADGLSGALEAVERALSRMRVPPAPDAPMPPSPPHPPATGQTIRIVPVEEADNPPPDAPAAAPPPDAPAAAPPPPSLDQERETILRMIAAGRISPEEGDLLLEALGS